MVSIFPPKPLDIVSPEGRCSEGLDAFRFFLNTVSLGVQYIWTKSSGLQCVCVFSSHSFCWTSSSLDVAAGGVTQEEGHTGFLIHLLSAVRALIFLARRIQPFLSLVDREAELCVLTI